MRSFDKFELVQRDYGQYLKYKMGTFVANSTQILTDLATAAAVSPSTTTQANATAAAGPIMDVQGNIKLVQLKAQEMAELLNYILNASMLPAAALTNPTAGPVTSASDSAIWNALVGVYQILK